MKENPEDDLVHEDDLVPEDDVVIARAVCKSFLAVAGLVVVVAAGFLLMSRRPEAAPEVAIETTAPVPVELTVTAPLVRFTDVTAEAGIDFAHENGAEGEKLLPETMGSGAAFFDFDGDDDQDLLLVNATYWPHSQKTAEPKPSSALYRNDGRGRFDDVTHEAGLDFSLYGTGIAVGDYDNDGQVDVFLAAVGENRLLRNEGGRFRDVTRQAGVAGEGTQWSSSASFVDVDNDGDLDLFVCNYVSWSRQIDQEVDYRLTGVGRAYGPPVDYEGTFPYLYRNNGDGTFTDVSFSSGVEVRNEVTGVAVAKALAIAPVDIDRDGAIDLLVANDTVRNFLFHNQGLGVDGQIVFQETACPSPWPACAWPAS